MAFHPYSIGVISDTHGRLDPQVFTLFEGVDLIVHAGDIGGDDLLIELGAIAPVQAVSGNVDFPPDRATRPLWRTLKTPAGRIAVTHGHRAESPSTGLDMMHAYFRDFLPDIIIYGHSHVPKLEEIGGVRIFNPGAAGQPRFGRPCSVGLITQVPDGPALIEHLPLGATGAP